MRTTRCLLAATALILCAAHQAAADERLPTSKDEAMVETDKAIINSYVQKWVGQLVDGSDDQVQEARQKLIVPLDDNPTQYFLIEYRRKMVGRLVSAFRSKRFIVRLNVMIIASALGDPGATNLLTDGLQDENPGVRYWSAMAVANITAVSDKLTDVQQQALLKALASALQVEQVEPVLQRLMLALAALDIPGAAPMVLDALNKRVPAHLANPRLALIAEIVGMKRLIRRMIADPNGVTSRDVRLFTIVAVRYFILAAMLLEENKIPESTMSDYVSMLERADEYLHWLAQQQGVTKDQLPQELRKPIKPLVDGKAWPRTKLRAAEWENLLLNNLKFKPEELEIKPPPKDE